MKNAENQPKTRWWEIVAKLTPLILGIGITGLGTFSSIWFEAKQTQLNQITALNDFRTLLISDEPADRAFAYEAFVALGYEDLAYKLVQTKNDPAGRPALGKIAELSSNVSDDAKTALKEIPVRVFIHIASETQRDSANSLSADIEKVLNFGVLPIDNISDEAIPPNRPEIRYFNQVDKSATEEIRSVMINFGFPHTEIVMLPYLKAKPGTVEVWFPKSDG